MRAWNPRSCSRIDHLPDFVVSIGFPSSDRFGCIHQVSILIYKLGRHILCWDEQFIEKPFMMDVSNKLAVRLRG